MVPSKYIATTRKHVAMHPIGPAKLLDRKSKILFRDISDKALRMSRAYSGVMTLEFLLSLPWL